MSEDFKKPSDDEKSKKEDLKEVLKENQEEEHIEKISKPVVIRADAYKTIILYSSRYANKSIPPAEWKEIYGILIGTSDEELVYVERAEGPPAIAEWQLYAPE